MQKPETTKTVVGPKSVRRANQWCVTIFTHGGMKGKTQEQQWFSTKQEAEEFITKFNEENDK